MAIPRILYSIDMWCVPIHSAEEGNRRKGSVHAIRKLTSMQQAGTLAITRGFHTSLTDTLDAHASALPMHLKVGKAFYRAAVRFASLPESHPLHRQYRLAGSRKVKRHWFALRHMAQLFGIKTNLVEMLPAVRQNPAERSRMPASISIPADKEALVQLNNNSHEVIKVYTDGLAHNGKVGVAAVLTRQGKVNRVL